MLMRVRVGDRADAILPTRTTREAARLPTLRRNASSPHPSQPRADIDRRACAAAAAGAGARGRPGAAVEEAADRRRDEARAGRVDVAVAAARACWCDVEALRHDQVRAASLARVIAT